IDETNWNEATTYLDSFGRTKKTRVKDSNGDVVSETQYDLLSRVKQVSNPFRIDANGNPVETIFWTNSSYDELGRLKFVTTPDNAVIETQYDLATTGTEIGTVNIVIDQALKQRRSVTNALGQLTRVDEPSITNNNQLGDIDAPYQPTKYEYNGLGDLKKVIQGAQERLFTYDSLKRLKSATNPESGTISYNYDANSNLTSKTDARNITTNYFYDRLNRVTKRTYTGESGYQTPQVEYFYDGKGLAQTGTFTKGKLTKVTSAVSSTEYTNFDGLGRISTHQQTTDGNTYTTSYIYNLGGALIEETYPSNR
ncbi:MAG TPA: hypothetical protein PKE69_27520, partial [Pyrinomonadaceae bacterium]|nr:hypothetical protein [Pyrinomonadaceae bacterium]